MPIYILEFHSLNMEHILRLHHIIGGNHSLGSVGWLSFGLGVLSRRWRTADLLFLVFSLNCLHLSLSFSLSLTFRLLVKASRTLLTGVVVDDKTMEMVLSWPSGLCGPEGEVWFNLEIEEFFVCCFKGDLGGVPVSLWNNQTEGEDPVCNRKFKVYKTFTIKPFLFSATFSCISGVPV